MSIRSLEAEIARTQLPERCEEVPIFPLPRVVLMPGGLLPLHVFEPRYRALVRHCLEGDGILGVATLKPGFRDDYHGAPAIWPELGIGVIVSHTSMDDGRSNIVVEQVARARVVSELESGQPFRVVRVQCLEDLESGAAVPLARLKALLLQLAAVRGGTPDEAHRLVALPSGELVDELARRLLEQPDDQRRYLAMDHLALRAEWIAERLGQLVAPVGTPAAEA